MFIQVKVDTQEEFDRAFAAMRAKGFNSDGACPDELVFSGPGFVKHNDREDMGYFWYSGMDLLPIKSFFGIEHVGYNTVEEFEATI